MRRGGGLSPEKYQCVISDEMGSTLGAEKKLSDSSQKTT